jgi:hypothetical protein
MTTIKEPMEEEQAIPERRAIGVYYAVATNKLDTQMQSIDQLDAKAVTLFTIASVILGFFVGLISLVKLPSDQPARIADGVFLILSIAAYAILAYCLYQAYKVVDWEYGPDLKALGDKSQEYDEETIQELVADACTISHESNRVLIDKKADWLQCAFIALASDIILIAVTISITAFAK